MPFLIVPTSYLIGRRDLVPLDKLEFPIGLKMFKDSILLCYVKSIHNVFLHRPHSSWLIQAEATNKTLLQILKKTKEDFPSTWDEQLPLAFWAYIISKRRATALILQQEKVQLLSLRRLCLISWCQRASSCLAQKLLESFGLGNIAGVCWGGQGTHISVKWMLLIVLWCKQQARKGGKSL